MTNQLSSKIERKLITFRTKETKEEESVVGRWFLLKWGIFERTTTSVLFIFGLSATIVRYFKKLVHRFTADSPKFYNFSFWLQMVAIAYVTYIFVYYFHLGQLQGRPYLKAMIIFVNFATILMIKLTMVEAEQTKVLCDHIMVTIGYVTYLFTYSFAGYPWLTFFLYLAILLNVVISRHFLNTLSKTFGNSIGLVFNDPENLDELIRLNIGTQLDDIPVN